MKRKDFMRFSRILGVAVLSSALLLGGCGMNGMKGMDGTADGAAVKENVSGSLGVAGSAAERNSEMFTNRDKEVGYEESKCTVISLNGDSASCDQDSVVMDGSTIVIRKEGDYLLRGTLKNGSVRVEASNSDKVRLILDGADISCVGTAPIYCKKADKVFITLAADSENKLTNTGAFEAVDENNIDAAIFSKCDLTLNGMGSLTVSSEEGHGIVSKDDLAIVSGNYRITSGDHGISGKDSIRIADGNIEITCAEDGLHSGNDEDADKGYVYIEGGNITISAGDDGIHGESRVQIFGGNISVLKSYEGIEAAIIEIAGGEISVTAADDGINAADGSGSGGFGKGFFGGRGQNPDANGDGAGIASQVYLSISGGKIIVNASGDGLDSNGNLYMSGGEVYVSGPENSGNGALDYESKAEITGGVLVAVGASGMAMNFSSASQGSALLTTASGHKAGEKVELKDSQGNVLLSYTPTSSFNSVVVSCPEMKEGGTYTLSVGSENLEFTLNQLIYGSSSGFGGMGGGRGGKGGFDGNMGDPSGREGFDGGMGGPGGKEGFDGNMGGPGGKEGFGGNKGGRGGRGGLDGNPVDPDGREGFDGSRGAPGEKAPGRDGGETLQEVVY